RTSTCTPEPLLGGMLEMRFRAGSMKAAVLPLPVCEETIRSWPSRALGMAAAWTEVGSVKPAFRTADNREGARPKVSKDMSILCRTNGIHIAGAMEVSPERWLIGASCRPNQPKVQRLSWIRGERLGAQGAMAFDMGAEGSVNC